MIMFYSTFWITSLAYEYALGSPLARGPATFRTEIECSSIKSSIFFVALSIDNYRMWRRLLSAGLWECWQNPQDNTIVQSCTIIVTDANAFMKPIHNRMPVILSPDDYSRWLDPTAGTRKSLLIPCPRDWLTSYPISSYVNSPKNNDSQCIESIA